MNKGLVVRAPDGFKCHGCSQHADSPEGVVHDPKCPGRCVYATCTKHHCADRLPSRGGMMNLGEF